MMENNQRQDFWAGMPINILENHQVIDRAVVLDIKDKRITIKSLQLFPKETSQFVQVGEEDGKISWALIGEGAFGEPCFSERAPFYTMVKARV